MEDIYIRMLNYGNSISKSYKAKVSDITSNKHIFNDKGDYYTITGNNEDNVDFTIFYIEPYLSLFSYEQGKFNIYREIDDNVVEDTEVKISTPL